MRVIVAFLLLLLAVPVSAGPSSLSGLADEEVRQCQKHVMDVINTNPEFAVQMERQTLMVEYTRNVIKITCKSEAVRRLEERTLFWQEEIRRMEQEIETVRKKRSRGSTM